MLEDPFVKKIKKIHPGKLLAKVCKHLGACAVVVPYSSRRAKKFISVMVEIKLGAEAGAIALGIASNEETGEGISEAKFERLKSAGAHAIVGDFLEIKEIEDFIFG